MDNKNNKKNTNNSECKMGCGEYKEDKYLSNNNDRQLCRKIIHDIKNIRPFSIDTLKNINNLSYEDRIQIFIAYNDMSIFYNNFINENL